MMQWKAGGLVPENAGPSTRRRGDPRRPSVGMTSLFLIPPLASRYRGDRRGWAPAFLWPKIPGLKIETWGTRITLTMRMHSGA
jgi:hypothetical protein